MGDELMEIVPHVGIGKVRLGMSREEAEFLLERGMDIGSRGSPPVVMFVQVSHRAHATYRGVDVFDEDRSADEGGGDRAAGGAEPGGSTPSGFIT